MLKLIAALLLIAGQAGAWTKKEEQRIWDQAADWWSQGYALDEIGAESVEKRLVHDPDNEAARFKVLCYYMNKFWDKGAKERYYPGIQRHYLWFIEKQPHKPYFSFWSSLAVKEYGEIHANLARAWMDAAKKRPNEAWVLGNAALFVGSDYPAWGAWYYQKAQRLEPKEPRWRQYLGDLLMSGAPVARSSAARALAEYEAAYPLAEVTADRYTWRLGLAGAALAAGEDAKAAGHAKALLVYNRHIPPVSAQQMGIYLHHANRILGQLALRQGRKAEAVSYLLKSGRIDFTPQLKANGPDFTLANELLAAGEGAAVVDFLKLCQNFWSDKKADAWIKEIQTGGRPLLAHKADLPGTK